ncbi:hypothetical protein JCM7686_2022 [Paracoccus aminophilus JCM 7686]|uniref:Uncharacterized protein n=1 Tax=Paracoccus aminophilus JCM 7686 TaxID=1367847 RepID=S5XSY6_PARAH|nr:hypothetical protein JCM7686_1229 [Paracoccus aminophilus JCM 7686]AGT10554.1 hypothetical protein JCM7686_2022 [Paracoccus aminophilus JCM 7686]
MMRVLWRMAQRYYAARHRRALRVAGRSAADAEWFKSQSERFFQRIKGASRE